MRLDCHIFPFHSMKRLPILLRSPLNPCCYAFFFTQTHMTICRRAPARLKRPHTTQDLDNRRQQPKLATCRDGVTRTVTVSARHTEGITNPIPRQYMLGQDSMYPRHGKVLTPNYSEAFPKPVGGYSHDGIKNTLPNANIFSKDTTSSEDDGRVACTACKRKFSPDRVEVHQDICQRVNGTKGRGRRDEEGELSSFHKPRRSSCPTFRCNGVKTPWRRGCSVGRERDKNWWRTVRARVEGHGKCLERHLQKPDGG